MFHNTFDMPVSSNSICFIVQFQCLLFFIHVFHLNAAFLYVNKQTRCCFLAELSGHWSVEVPGNTTSLSYLTDTRKRVRQTSLPVCQHWSSSRGAASASESVGGSSIQRRAEKKIITVLQFSGNNWEAQTTSVFSIFLILTQHLFNTCILCSNLMQLCQK